MSEEQDRENQMALLRMERDGYKNANAALVARLASLESGGDDARLRELTAEIVRLQQTNEALHRELTNLKLDYEHGVREHKDYAYYKRKAGELKSTQEEILKLLGHGECDGLDHSYDWDY